MPHAFKFFLAGGFDQVRIDTAADLLNLKDLDQKLWVALSCPTTGIEFDARTLALIDTDNDGHIRAPELLAAIDWAAARLNDSSVFEKKLAGVPLAAIQDEAVLAAARGLLPEGEALVSVDAASAAEAEYSARALAAWEAAGADAKPLGDATEAACAALAAVREKLDDFFVRCRLAAFDARAEDAMNASDDSFKALGGAALSNGHADIAALPIARVGAGATVPLGAGIDSGINPAWAERIGALREAVVVPLLGARPGLSESDWLAVQDQLAVFSAWQAAKPAGLPPEAEAVRDLERLARYVRDLLPLANNFVAFRDFYTRQGKACFQIGTLYLDGRAAELVISVNDAGKHAALAGLSRICLVYCECTRPGAKQTIAAAFTAGDSDQLMVGRNGVFYDRQGRDWDATISKIVDHPISLRQAFWSPYKKLARMVAEQLQKLAASKATPSRASSPKPTTAAVKKVDAPPAKPPCPAGLRRRQVRRHLRRHRPCRRRPGHRRRRRGHRPARPQVVAVAAGRRRPAAADFRPGGDRCLVQAAQPQPRPHPRCQRLGGECPRPHQHPLRHLADASRHAARRRRTRADRSVCGKGKAVEDLRIHRHRGVHRAGVVDLALSVVRPAARAPVVAAGAHPPGRQAPGSAATSG
jgi:hypothetical protein